MIEFIELFGFVALFKPDKPNKLNKPKKSTVRTQKRESAPFKSNKLDVILCLFFLIVWILPLLYSNVTKSKIPLFPSFWQTVTSTSNLFTRANYVWPVPYMQVQLQPDGEWLTLPEEDYFPMRTFGYRTRLFEALYLAVQDDEKSLAVQRELAQWIVRRYAQANGRAPVAVRFIAGLHRSQWGQVLDGHWRTPPLYTFPDSDVYVLSRHDARGGQ